MTMEEFAWKLYESERDFIKHHENQRTNASSILAAVYAALIVALSSGLAEGVAALFVTTSLVLTGIFGAIFSGKLYELIQMHAGRSYGYLDIVNSKFPDIEIARIKESVKLKQKQRFRVFASISLNRIWFNFHCAIVFLGLLLTAITALDVLELPLPTL